jgi:hypothetical protein
MSLQQLARNDCRNHVEVVYASGETYKMRNVASVLYSQQDGKVSIQKITTSGGVEAKGVVKSQIEMETVELDVGVLAGLVVSHCSNEAMNRYTMNTFLTFVDRGELFGGVMPKENFIEVGELVEQLESGEYLNTGAVMHVSV